VAPQSESSDTSNSTLRLKAQFAAERLMCHVHLQVPVQSCTISNYGEQIMALLRFYWLLKLSST
jgi:hypothetical protein